MTSRLRMLSSYSTFHLSGELVEENEEETSEGGAG